MQSYENKENICLQNYSSYSIDEKVSKGLYVCLCFRRYTNMVVNEMAMVDITALLYLQRHTFFLLGMFRLFVCLTWIHDTTII